MSRHRRLLDIADDLDREKARQAAVEPCERCDAPGAESTSVYDPKERATYTEALCDDCREALSRAEEMRDMESRYGADWWVDS